LAFTLATEATFQIRNIPDPLHQLLQIRAPQHHRSLSLQALKNLQVQTPN
jgi:plasmid stability protein